jgi:hypothetical protein
MLVLVTADGKVWKLAVDLTSWSEFSAGSSGTASTAWADITGRPTTFPPSAHTHVIADTSGLQAALDSKQVAGSYAASVHTHNAGQISGLATVATSGSYSDLSGLPTIPGAYTLPAATGSVLGGVKAGANVSVASDGTISVAAPTTSLAATAVTGLATVATTGSYADLSNKPSIPAAYTLPAASSATLGGVKVGSNVSVATDGTISVSAPVTTLAASAITGLAAVATSGAYSDLSGLPTIPSATTSASDLTAGTLSQARLDFVPIHPFLLMGG